MLRSTADRTSQRHCAGHIGGRAVGALVAGVLSLVPAIAVAQTLDEAIELHAGGNYAEALDAYRAVAAATEASDPFAAAIALNNSCVIQMDLGDYRAALETGLGAERLIRVVDDDELRSQNLNNLGVVHQHLGRYTESEQYFRAALDTNRSLGYVDAQVINLANLGALATAAGWYSRAIDAYLSAEALASEHESEPWASGQIHIARINRGVVFEKLGEIRQALDLYRDVLEHRDELDPWHEAALQLNVGVLYRNLGDPVRAVQAFEAAIASYETLGDMSGLSNAHLNLALARHLNLDEPEAAERSYRTALELARSSGDRTEEIQGLFYLADLLSDMGRTAEAEQAFELCLAASEESGSAEGTWSALAGLGRTASARGDLREALGFLERAMSTIEDVRADLDESSQRSGFFGDKRPIFVDAVEVLAQLDGDEPGQGYAERALYVVQRAKARQLLDALGPGARPVIPQTAEELRQRVGDDTLLEYFVGQDAIFLWIVRSDGIRMVDVGRPRLVLPKIAALHSALIRGGAPDDLLLHELSESLLGPAGAELATVTGMKIAPDGRLHYLPFELLPDPEAPDGLVVDRLTVSYLPSASTLAPPDDSDVRPDRKFLGFGDPTPAGDSREWPSASRLLLSRFELGPLPEAQSELAAARRWLGDPGESWTGQDATEQNFREATASGARVVHLATHALVLEPPGQGPAILFAPSGDDDGLLYASEISSLDLRADLTVLAACRTAIGAPEDGLGLTTLTGAFLAAGSSAVLATLWDVGDVASAAFMEQFYYELGRGVEPAAALRHAKLSMRADPRWDRPDVWAAYVLIGEAPGIVERTLVPFWALFLAVALLAAAAGARLARQRASA